MTTPGATEDQLHQSVIAWLNLALVPPAFAAGIINQAFAGGELEERVLSIAERMAGTSAAVLAVNKRAVHTAIEARGGRSVIRTLGDLQAGPHLSAMGADEILDKVKSGK